jgi:hypothetical protein
MMLPGNLKLGGRKSFNVKPQATLSAVACGLPLNGIKQNRAI